MSGSVISGLLAWEALDSRGDPTVACEVVLAGGARGSAVVPAGASTGAHEAVELRDGGERWGGRGVRRAVANVQGELADAVVGLDAGEQEALDGALRAADGTATLGRLGANAVLAVSLAAALAAAEAAGLPFYRRLLDGREPLLPLPMVNIVSGGAHAGEGVDLQDFLVVPVGAKSFAEAIEWSWRVRRATQNIALERGLPAALVADEGGLGPSLPSNRAALELLLAGIERSGLKPGIEAAIAIDVAATQLARGDSYELANERRTLTPAALVELLAGWCAEYPIVSIEDPLGEDDWSGWQLATHALPAHVQLIGDDLFATNTERLEHAIKTGIANAALIKPNQAGTLTAAQDTIRLAADTGYATIISARSGDTEDTWLADLAVGWRTGQIKVGSTTRSERTAKWNRLLRIETELGEQASYARTEALGRSPSGTRR